MSNNCDRCGLPLIPDFDENMQEIPFHKECKKLHDKESIRFKHQDNTKTVFGADNTMTPFGTRNR